LRILLLLVSRLIFRSRGDETDVSVKGVVFVGCPVGTAPGL
jgi:hypothetical protein